MNKKILYGIISKNPEKRLHRRGVDPKTNAASGTNAQMGFSEVERDSSLRIEYSKMSKRSDNTPTQKSLSKSKFAN